MQTKIERRMSSELNNKNELKSLKALKDCKDVDDLDFNKFELIRGETPVDIKEKCLELCKDYLCGNWRQQTVDTIAVKRISGGLSNQIYVCRIHNPNLSTNDEEVPQEVAVRLYNKKYFNFDGNEYERMTDIIVAQMVSQNKLGPKLYGLFEGGEIQAFYKHRQFKIDEQNDPKLVKELFKKLAQMHAMVVPIRKRHTIYTKIDTFYSGVVENSAENTQMIKELNCETLLKHDLSAEIDWIKELLSKTRSPFVFTHNDFRSSNIMVLENNDNNNNESNAVEIKVCDFEGASYGYRGSDFGTLFYEWGRTWNDYRKLHYFPADEAIRQMIEFYVEESERIFGLSYSENAVNSVDQILNEVKMFSMIETMFSVLLTMKNDENIEKVFPISRPLKMKFAEIAYKNYWHLKTQFMAQNVFE